MKTSWELLKETLEEAPKEFLDEFLEDFFFLIPQKVFLRYAEGFFFKNFLKEFPNEIQGVISEAIQSWLRY